MNDIALVLLHKLCRLFTPHERSMLKALTENPENHNGVYRGKDLTNIYTIEQIYERVHDGSFEDLYLGDYFTVNITTDLYTRFTGSAFVSGVTYYEMGGTVIARTWTETQDETPQSGKIYATKQVVTEDVDLMIAHFDYYISRGAQSAVSSHHVILMPKNEHLKKLLPMHYTPSVACPYVETDMHNIHLPCFAAAFYAALNAHMLPFNTSLVSEISDNVLSMTGSGFYGAATNYINTNAYLVLPTEQQIYGQTLASSSVWEARIDYDKFAIFNFVDARQGATTSEKIFLRTFVGKAAGNYSYEQLSALGAIGMASQSSSRGVDPYMLFG